MLPLLDASAGRLEAPARRPPRFTAFISLGYCVNVQARAEFRDDRDTNVAGS